MPTRFALLTVTFAGISLLAGLCPRLCHAADAPPASPFDKDDPEIAELRKLDWKGVDFDKLDARARCTGFFAINKALQKLGGKADARLELLIDYIDEQNLGEAYAAEKGLGGEFKPVSFDDLEKVAGAYLKTPAGSAKFGKEFASTSDDLLDRYLALYEKTARREYEETCESRLQVRSMGLFLEHKGKLDEFQKWAVEERKRRQEEFQKQLAEQQAAAQQAAADAREKAKLAAEERKRQEEELAARQLEYAMQQQQGSGSNNYDGDALWGGNWGYGQGDYYYGNAYRGQVRDKAQDAVQRRRTGRPSQLPGAGRGGRR